MTNCDTTAEHDGYLTAVEWIGYQLKSDLMVMSACQTGLGETVSGEGIMGLPYALYIAGNKNTLMTLFQVDDAITAEFMRRFFTKLNHGTSHSGPSRNQTRIQTRVSKSKVLGGVCIVWGLNSTRKCQHK